MKQLLLEPVDACEGVVTGAGVEGEETFDEAFGNGENLGVEGEKGHTGYNRTLANCYCVNTALVHSSLILSDNFLRHSENQCV